jgi:Helix-hairpin-helix motif
MSTPSRYPPHCHPSLMLPSLLLLRLHFHLSFFTHFPCTSIYNLFLLPIFSLVISSYNLLLSTQRNPYPLCVLLFTLLPLIPSYPPLISSPSILPSVFLSHLLFISTLLLLSPLQHLLGNVKVPLLTVLEHCLVDAVCEVGVDLSLAVQNDHLATMIAFVGGLGNAHSRILCGLLFLFYAEAFMSLLLAAPTCLCAYLPACLSIPLTAHAFVLLIFPPNPSSPPLYPSPSSSPSYTHPPLQLT